MTPPAKQVDVPVATPRIAAEVRYPLPQMLAEIRGEGTNRALGLEHLSQAALQSLFKTYKERSERTRNQ